MEHIENSGYVSLVEIMGEVSSGAYGRFERNLKNELISLNHKTEADSYHSCWNETQWSSCIVLSKHTLCYGLCVEAHSLINTCWNDSVVLGLMH